MNPTQFETRWHPMPARIYTPRDPLADLKEAASEKRITEARAKRLRRRTRNLARSMRMGQRVSHLSGRRGLIVETFPAHEGRVGIRWNGGGRSVVSVHTICLAVPVTVTHADGTRTVPQWVS